MTTLEIVFKERNGLWLVSLRREEREKNYSRVTRRNDGIAHVCGGRVCGCDEHTPPPKMIVIIITIK